MTVRTRFAPSPTGYLHIGSARTALYNWLFAKKNKGQFILRIEDTDLERSTEASIQAILQGMHWLNLSWDEGPFYQMQRLSRYHEVAEQLLTNNLAYRCDCSKERLEKLRQKQIEQKLKPRYDGHCRERQLAAAPSGTQVIRLKTPEQGSVSFVDEVYGPIEIQNSELDDLVLLRSDQVPTYNFAVVIDDLDMQITHVIRGDDHINNTPRQLHIYKALTAIPPVFAHLPMILGSDGKRLSKRHGATSVMEYRDQGYLPEALLNYLLRLGWSHGDQEIFSLHEMIDLFDLKHVNRSPAAFNIEKLQWLNHYYLKNSSAEMLTPLLVEQIKKLNLQTMSDFNYAELISLQTDRSKTLQEMAEKSQYFFSDEVVIDPSAAEKHLTSAHLANVKYFSEQVRQLQIWDQPHLHDCLQKTCAQLQLKFPELAQPLRVVLTGNTTSPSIDKTMALLGKQKVFARLQKILT